MAMNSTDLPLAQFVWYHDRMDPQIAMSTLLRHRWLAKFQRP